MHIENSDKCEGLFALVRCGLWHTGSFSQDICSGGEEFWKDVYGMARRQTVTGLVYDAFSVLPEDVLPPDKVLFAWAAAADAVERENRKMNHALAGLLAMFRAGGVDPVLQKGQGVARFYVSPMLRECGDIDFYFPDSSNADRAVELLGAQGVKVEKMPDGSCHYTWQGVVVEHHPRLLDIYNPFARKLLGELEREHGFSTVKLAACGGLEVRIPSPFLELLLLNTHIMKHALGWGIGLRQLCDMVLACRELYGMYDSSEMKAVCARLGITRWNRLLHEFMAGKLGLDRKYMPYQDYAKDCSRLERIVTRGGNFGLHSRNRDGAGSVWRRKLHTMRSFIDNAGFSYTCAPKEAFWTFMNLLTGQLDK